MKSFFKLITCSTIVLFSSNTSFTQELNRENIQTFFNDVISNPDSYHKTPSNFGRNKLAILDSLEVYRIDSISNVRKYAFLIANNLTKNDTNSILNQNVVNFLLKGFNDSNSGICGIVSDFLKDYPKKSYNDNSRNKILELLYLTPPYYHELLKVAGYINPDSTIENITKLLSSGIIKNNEPYWAAKLALARMGDYSAIEFCMRQIKVMEVNDDLVYDYVPDLIYTHQREAIDFLIQLLHSNEKNCESSNAESTEMIVCGYRIMEYLAPVIEEFPLKISDSGDIDTNDYAEALQICRDWFLEHPNYKIINEKY